MQTGEAGQAKQAGEKGQADGAGKMGQAESAGEMGQTNQSGEAGCDPGLCQMHSSSRQVPPGQLTKSLEGRESMPGTTSWRPGMTPQRMRM